LEVRIENAQHLLGEEHGAHQNEKIIGHQDILCLSKPCHAEKGFRKRPLFDRHGGIVGNDIGQATLESGPVHFAAKHADVDGGVQQPFGVLAHESGGESSQFAPCGPVEKPSQAKVMETNPTVTGYEQISRMGVSVEDAQDENLMQVGVHKILG